MNFSFKLNLTIYIMFLASFSNAREFITPNLPLKDTGDSIVSRGGQFELGFFHIGSGRYLGIRYHNFANSVIFWVANRNTPLNDTSGVLTLTQQGTLLLSTTTTSVTRNIWWTNVLSPSDLNNPIARLLDTGNLVVGSSNSSHDFIGTNYLWESFDHPGNTFMPTMKLGKNKYVTSWVSEDDPSEGNSIFYLDPYGYPQLFVKKENRILFRIGPWNGERFSGGANMKPNLIYTYHFVYNEREMYYEFNVLDNKAPTRLVLNTSGILQRWLWVEKEEGWVLYLTAQVDKCDTFNMCGPFGRCMINNSPPCGCLDGFEPKYPMSWNSSNWGDGCVRSVKLECRKGGFKRVSGLKLPDTRKAMYTNGLSLKECKRLCHHNCSCIAFANLDIRKGGGGCLMWFDQLMDIRDFGNGGQDLYLRLDASQLGKGSYRRKLVRILVPMLSIGAVSLILWLTLLHKTKQRKLKSEGMRFHTEDKDIELPLFDFAKINKATHNFSSENKLGQGGFGIVYKGIVDDGQEIAIKRLSKHSKQGIIEFKNEVSCIVKLQHRNLVKLLGCCIQGEERVLIYEYMPNKSLDLLIFDRVRKCELDWEKRFNIINGTARGLSYLHHDSRLRIIHRDLKTSNVLLDQNLNPKISDFGMARIFGGEETDQENTNRVVGTYGYMAPEYAIDGIFSVKSDVYSFGVLVLEVVSGKKNRGFSHPDHELNLLGHAWRLHKQDKSMELLDFSLNESAVHPQVMRAIHVGLLCVQKSPEVRPSMSMVNLMLGSTISLPDPKEPGFFTERNFNDPSSSSSSLLDTSPNEISVTVVEAR